MSLFEAKGHIQDHVRSELTSWTHRTFSNYKKEARIYFQSWKLAFAIVVVTVNELLCYALILSLVLKCDGTIVRLFS